MTFAERYYNHSASQVAADMLTFVPEFVEDLAGFVRGAIWAIEYAPFESRIGLLAKLWDEAPFDVLCYGPNAIPRLWNPENR